MFIILTEECNNTGILTVSLHCHCHYPSQIVHKLDQSLSGNIADGGRRGGGGKRVC